MAILFLLIALITGATTAYLQPLLGKMVLPIFGGSAQTWNVILLSFSGLIFISSVYVVGVLQRFTQRKQALFQIVMCLICIGIIFSNGLILEKNDFPLITQMFLLSAKIFPFLLLGWGTVFLSHGWVQFHGAIKEKPLLIFAAAYLGSAIGLFVFHMQEPSLPISEMFAQLEVTIWALGILVLVVLFFSLRSTDELGWLDRQTRYEGTQPWLSWFIISFATGSLLLGFTHLIGAEFASSPLIWIVPMGVFAFSLCIAFFNPYVIPTHILFILMMLTSIPLMIIHVFAETIPSFSSFGLHAVFFVSATLLLHKYLGVFSGAKARPSFFVFFTAGQSLAALFFVAAPFLFHDYVEYPLTMIIALGLAALLWQQELPEASGWKKASFWSALLPFGAMLVVSMLVVSDKDSFSAQKILVLASIMAASLAMLMRTPLLLASGLAGLVLAPHFEENDKLLFKARSFYGMSQVQNWRQYRLYSNGSTIHGAQPLYEKRAVTYYNEEGPIGRFFKVKQDYTHQHPVAVLGLGVGCIMTYMAPQQAVDFYEIDPLVSEVADKYFSYLKDSTSDIGITLGDGRIEIAKVAPDKYGLIMLDAFSSDAVPSHLLTLEAFKIYLSKLKWDGIILTNITNRYLDLYPALQALAVELGLSVARGVSTETDENNLIFATDWVAFSRDSDQLTGLDDEKIWHKESVSKVTHTVWKDDFVDIKKLFKK